MAQKNQVNEIIGMMEEWFSKLPALPTNWREVLVKVTPWIALIFGVLGVVLSLLGLGVLAFLSPFVFMAGGWGAATGGPVAAVLWLASSALMLLAYKGLSQRKLGGWNFLFWSEVVSLVSSVVLFSVTGVLGALVGFYLLFQIKSYYK